ncbi:MAG: acyl carrier protein [Planctomycetes bacterium]|nr:acyl carrier protein [Planctomycetota bacterium]
MENLNSRIKELLVEMLFLDGVDPASIGDGDNLEETLGVDSVALFQVVAGLEEAFDIRVEDDDFNAETFATVNGIAGFVEGKLSVDE